MHGGLAATYNTAYESSSHQLMTRNRFCLHTNYSYNYSGTSFGIITSAGRYCDLSCLLVRLFVRSLTLLAPNISKTVEDRGSVPIQLGGSVV